MRIANSLIRLGGCRCRSESSLGAHVVLFVLSCGGSYRSWSLCSSLGWCLWPDLEFYCIGYRCLHFNLLCILWIRYFAHLNDLDKCVCPPYPQRHFINIMFSSACSNYPLHDRWVWYFHHLSRKKACTECPKGSRCMLFAGQVMKISCPPVVKRVINLPYYIITLLAENRQT